MPSKGAWCPRCSFTQTPASCSQDDSGRTVGTAEKNLCASPKVECWRYSVRAGSWGDQIKGETHHRSQPLGGILLGIVHRVFGTQCFNLPDQRFDLAEKQRMHKASTGRLDERQSCRVRATRGMATWVTHFVSRCDEGCSLLKRAPSTRQRPNRRSAQPPGAS